LPYGPQYSLERIEHIVKTQKVKEDKPYHLRYTYVLVPDLEKEIARFRVRKPRRPVNKDWYASLEPGGIVETTWLPEDEEADGKDEEKEERAFEEESGVEAKAVEAAEKFSDSTPIHGHGPRGSKLKGSEKEKTKEKDTGGGEKKKKKRPGKKMRDKAKRKARKGKGKNM
jgi:hypothetical protein